MAELDSMPGFAPSKALSLREGSGNPLQYSCLENSMGRRGVMGYSLWGCKESGTTKQLTHIQSSLLLCSETSRKLEDEELHQDSPSWGSLPPLLRHWAGGLLFQP